MLKCPACDNTLDQDFGMVTCSNCNAVLMIDISGHVRTATDEPIHHDEFTDPLDDETEAPEASMTEAEPFDEVATLDEEYVGSYQSAEFSAPQEGDDSGYDPISADMDELDGGEGPDHDESQEADDDDDDPEEGDFVGDDLDGSSFNGDDFDGSSYGGDDFDGESFDDDADSEDSDQPSKPLHTQTTSQNEMIPDSHSSEDYEEGESEVSAFAMPSEPDTTPVDITNYANSEASSLEEGELLYDLYLGRIDSKELRETLKYVLMDEKLQLNYHEYLRKIKDGKVSIENLNPIKTKRIVEQLQYCDIDISWVQKRIVMESVEPEMDEESPSEVGDDANI